MSADDDAVDVIVVGAGLAGIACAYRLALAGQSVILVERGTTAGSKNVSGGRLYTYALDLVEPGLAGQAPWERAVVQERITLMDGDRSMTISLAGARAGAGAEAGAGAVAGAPDGAGPGGGSPTSVTVLRADFDQWLAARAEAAGVLLATGIRVDSLLEENGRIVGIVAGGEEMRARVVVAADGVNSVLGREAGLVADVSAHAVGLGVKEVIALDAPTIESRFGLAPGEGVASLMLGCTRGMRGGGFLYTNRDSVSLGVVVSPDQLGASDTTAADLLQDLKAHPAIRQLIAGGSTVEYAAHLVCEQGWRGVPKRLTREGFLVTGEAAGFVLNLGYTVRGMDLALVSGVAAAEAIVASGDNVAGGELESAYRAALERTSLPATMRATAGFGDLLDIERLYAAYPGIALDIAQSLFTVDGGKPQPLRRAVTGAMRGHGVSWRAALRDGWKGMRSL